MITTVAGNGTPGFAGDGGSATSAQLEYPTSVAVNAKGDLYVSGPYDGLVREISNATITTVVGGGPSLGDGDPAIDAALHDVAGVALDSGGNLYIADSGDNRIREVSNGVINTLAGNGTCCFNGEGGPATGAAMATVYGVATDSAGNVLISDMFIGAGAYGMFTRSRRA